jgi:hypothetical protein
LAKCRTKPGREKVDEDDDRCKRCGDRQKPPEPYPPDRRGARVPAAFLYFLLLVLRT